MLTVTPEAVWAAQLRDPEFGELPADMLIVLQEFVMQLPTLCPTLHSRNCAASQDEVRQVLPQSRFRAEGRFCYSRGGSRVLFAKRYEQVDG